MTAGEREGIGGGGSGDVLAKVTAGNAVYVRRSKVACRVAEFSSLALAPFAFLPSRRPPPPPPPLPHVRLSVRSSVRPSAISLLLPLTWDPAARRRLQECTKCTALTDTRPRSTASTCLLRPFASPCFSPPLHSPPPSVSLFLLVSPSRSFVSFFSGRLLRLRGPLSHPLHRSAAAAVATPGYEPLLYHRCGSAPLLFHALIVRTAEHACTHARMHARNACGPVRRRGTLCRRCRGYIPGRPSRRVLTTCVLAPSRRAFSFSLLSSR